MEELLKRMLQGVDLTAPDAGWQLFLNMLALIPWVPMLIFTVFTVIVGLAIAWYRRSSYGLALLWALLLGPVGWAISWQWVWEACVCPDCGHEVAARRKRCRRCGCNVRRAK